MKYYVSAIGAIVKTTDEFYQCNDGTLSTAKVKPCSSRKGVKKLAGKLLKNPSGGFVKMVDVDKIYVNKTLFQNRETDFSSESANKIINAVDNGTFKWVNFDPIILWLSPDDRKLYVLSGHSRTAAFQTLYFKKKLKQFRRIPAKIFKGSKAEAIELALNSNTLATPEKESERARYYRAQINTRGLKEVKKMIVVNEGLNASRITAYIFLNPTGKTMTAVKALEGKEGSSEEGSRKLALWIGKTRELIPELTNRHEDEMYDFLLDQNEITRQDEFTLRVQRTVSKLSMFGKFDANQPLNLSNYIYISPILNAHLMLRPPSFKKICVTWKQAVLN